jgi:N-acetyl sugar amidotransferase
MNINQTNQTMIRPGEPGYRQCSRCIMDTTDPWIVFDEQGRCNHCLRVDEFKLTWKPEGDPTALERLLDQVKRDGKGRDYDVVLGLSGGVDSSYIAYLCKTWDLRALVIHVDTGWNSELAVKNIECLIHYGGFDLDTLVVDWDEMRDLQLAFFRSGVPNQDIPQDHAIMAGFTRQAAKHNVRWTFIGSNHACESILPQAWVYDNRDLTHIRDIHRKFGQGKLAQFPTLSRFEAYLRYRRLQQLNRARPLDLIYYSKDEAIKTMETEVGWRYYGGKHYESRFTKFFQGWYLPTKWGYDKRLAHLASIIMSGQISRDEALREFQNGTLPIEEVKSDHAYMASKLGISDDQFAELMQVPNTPHSKYATTSPALRLVGKWFNKIAKKLGV